MASRKEQKEQARAARLAQEQDAASKAQRNRRFQMFGGATVIAVIVIVVAIVASSSGGASPKGAHVGLEQGTKQHQLVSSVDTLLNKIPQTGNTLGSPTAKVTMQYFGDLECPYCQAFTLDVFPSFVAQEVKTGHVKVEYRSMCTATCDAKHSQAVDEAQFKSQQVAAYAAGKQNKFWQFAELFYHQQESEGTLYPTNAWLTGLAKQIPGFNVQTWQTDRKDPSLADELAADQQYSNKANLPGTPSLIMTGPKGAELVNNGDLVTSESQLTTAVKAVS